MIEVRFGFTGNVTGKKDRSHSQFVEVLKDCRGSKVKLWPKKEQIRSETIKTRISIQTPPEHGIVAGFSDFDISPNLVQALEKQGLTKPFEVQVETIPEAMLGKDICCRAPTGSGKTLAFGLPLLERSKKAKSKHPTSLILTPTRELAEQIRNVLSPLAKSIDRDVLSIYGGTPYQPQLRGLKNGVVFPVMGSIGLMSLPFRRLQGMHDKAKLSGEADPPCFSATMWSRWNVIQVSDWWTRQYSHRHDQIPDAVMPSLASDSWRHLLPGTRFKHPDKMFKPFKFVQFTRFIGR